MVLAPRSLGKELPNPLTFSLHFRVNEGVWGDLGVEIYG